MKSRDPLYNLRGSMQSCYPSARRKLGESTPGLPQLHFATRSVEDPAGSHLPNYACKAFLLRWSYLRSSYHYLRMAGVYRSFPETNLLLFLDHYDTSPACSQWNESPARPLP